MPEAITSYSHHSTTRSGGHPPSRKSRVARRRGRGKGDTESDDEIEREVGTDSDSEGKMSSLESASDSDTEPASEDVVPNGHAQTLNPKRMENIHSRVSKELVNGNEASFFASTGNWSEMVVDETTNGPADLPVIDFADLNHSSMAPPIRTYQSQNLIKKAKPGSTTDFSQLANEELEEAQFVASTFRDTVGSISNRRSSQTARQAYQQRLERDPSYVPTVGGFWGHDDRLLDKDLRSLSGWWRGRWYSRGRGRGRGGFERGIPSQRAGRGGYLETPHPIVSNQNVDQLEISSLLADVPPIDRAWTHDGFEEMRRRDEHRRGLRHAQSCRGFGNPHRDRGSFFPGRGRGFGRGDTTPSPSRSQIGLPFVSPSGRPWFTMKPERMWTKQHEGFLHVDPALKPRPGQGPCIRVKLPGDRVQIVRGPPRSYQAAPTGTAKSVTTGDLDSELGEASFIVRLPTNASTRTPGRLSTIATEPGTASKEPSLVDIFTVRHHLAAPISLSLPQSATSQPAIRGSSIHLHGPSYGGSSTPILPEQTAQKRIEYPSDEDDGWVRIQRGPVEQPSDELATIQTESSITRPFLPPLQTVFTPAISQTSTTYSSTCGYGPPLPQGIAMNQHGIPYELATGRPVYLQPNPRPILHTHMAHPSPSFVPMHIHNHSNAPPNFVAQPLSQTPSINGFVDPSTGIPIFSLPRQSSRIEIRAPTEQSDRKASSKSSLRPSSSLRTNAAIFDPSRLSNDATGYSPSAITLPDTGVISSCIPNSVPDDDPRMEHHQQAESAMLAYSTYPQQYYYPGSYAEHYGYPQYADLSHLGRYEMYPLDLHGTVYY